MKVAMMTALPATLLLLAGSAEAYVGPGAGLSALGAVWGLIAAIGTALGFVLLWPIRSLIRSMRARRAGGTKADAAPPVEPPR
jgi:hypothetical protein